MMYILNPDYIIRNDEKRILLFTKANPSEYSSKSWFGMIHPVQAMVLSFFSKKRTLNEAINLISSFLGIDYDETQRKIMPFIENKKPFINNFDGYRFHFPAMLIIKAGNKSRDEFLPEDMICKKNDFFTSRLFSAPLHLSLMLTNSCVTNCCYCYADMSKQGVNSLSTNKILELIKEAKGIKLKNFRFAGGGEVLLHKDWDSILKELLKNDFYPEIISTKIPLTEEILSKFEETNYTTNIQLSIDSVSSDILKCSLCVQEGYLDKVKNGIRLMENKNFSYQIATVLTKFNDNVEDMSDMFKFLKSLKKIKSWRISPAMNSLYKDYQDFAIIKTNQDRILKVYSFIEKMMKPYAHFEIQLDYAFLNRRFYSSEGSTNFTGEKCSALNNHFFILPDGKVTICEQLFWNKNFIIGDVNTSTLTQIWNSPQSLRLAYMEKKIIDGTSKCKSCRIFKKCFDNRNRCWVDVIKAYGDEHWDYPDPRCKWAPKMIHTLNY